MLISSIKQGFGLFIFLFLFFNFDNFVYFNFLASSPSISQESYQIALIALQNSKFSRKWV